MGLAPTFCANPLATKLVTVNFPTGINVEKSNLCIGEETEFNTELPVSGAWNFGAGAVPGVQVGVGPFSVSYTTAGVKTITFANPGCPPVTQTVEVVAAPENTFEIPQVICSGTVGTLRYTGEEIAGAVYNWSCDGCEGLAGATVGPHSISWNSIGEKTVTLQVTGPAPFGCSGPPVTAVVTVNQVPEIVQTRDKGCTGEVIVFRSTFARGDSQWDFGAGSTPATAEGPVAPEVTYSTAGTKTITLTNPGCPPVSVTLDIYAMPDNAFSVDLLGGCLGSKAVVEYTGVPVEGASYSWDCDGCLPGLGGNIGAQTITWPTTGEKTLKLTVTGPAPGLCQLPPKEEVITISESNPLASFTADEVCLGSVTTFYSTHVTTQTSWQFGTGSQPSVATGPGPHYVTYASAGEKTVVFNKPGCPPVEQRYQVRAIPESSFRLTMGASCSGSVGLVEYLGYPEIPGSSYEWSCGGCEQTLTGAGPHEISWLEAGKKTISLLVRGPSPTNCPSRVTEEITEILAVSEITEIQEGGCEGNSFKYMITAPGGNCEFRAEVVSTDMATVTVNGMEVTVSRLDNRPEDPLYRTVELDIIQSCRIAENNRIVECTTRKEIRIPRVNCCRLNATGSLDFICLAGAEGKNQPILTVSGTLIAGGNAPHTYEIRRVEVTGDIENYKTLFSGPIEEGTGITETVDGNGRYELVIRDAAGCEKIVALAGIADLDKRISCCVFRGEAHLTAATCDFPVSLLTLHPIGGLELFSYTWRNTRTNVTTLNQMVRDEAITEETVYIGEIRSEGCDNQVVQIPAVTTKILEAEKCCPYDFTVRIRENTDCENPTNTGIIELINGPDPPSSGGYEVSYTWMNSEGRGSMGSELTVPGDELYEVALVVRRTGSSEDLCVVKKLVFIPKGKPGGDYCPMGVDQEPHVHCCPVNMD